MNRFDFAAAVVFSWDPLHAGPSLRIGSDGWSVTKLNSSPDVAVVLGEQPLTQGTYKWRLKVEVRVPAPSRSRAVHLDHPRAQAKHDEMWLGITDDSELHRKVSGGEIRSHRRMYVQGRSSGGHARARLANTPTRAARGAAGHTATEGSDGASPAVDPSAYPRPHCMVAATRSGSSSTPLPASSSSP